MRKRCLRSGFTTGACAAAAAKAAVLVLLDMTTEGTGSVEIPFPDGSRVRFGIHRTGTGADGRSAWASVVKDAGDDPDVTNGAEIAAEVSLSGTGTDGGVVIRGGTGVGVVTKPGLPVPVGEPAINPVPRRMIIDAVREGLGMSNFGAGRNIEVTISVPDGEELAKKTLNYRLGIVNGISILGTTGIVKPLSSEAWTATITSSMDVARALGYKEIVLSTGRTSEKAHMKRYGMPVESYVMMGDYIEYSLREAVKHGFIKIHLCAQWAKLLKIAMSTPQTHVRHGAIDIKKAIAFLRQRGVAIENGFNTARDIFDFIVQHRGYRSSAFVTVCGAAREYCEGLTESIPVHVHLASYEKEIVVSSG